LRTTSEVGFGKKVEVPEWVLSRLGNPSYIRWRFVNERIIVDAGPKERTPAEFKPELRGAELLSLILKELIQRPLTFNALKDKLRIGSATLSKYLRQLSDLGLVYHKSRKASYEISNRGRDYFETLKVKPVEDFAIEILRSESFDGSIILRLPKRFMQVFRNLYAPKPLESLRRIFQVAFEFWVEKYSQAPNIVLTAYGRDFNKDDIWDLCIWENPSGGYPEIKKALKDKSLGRPMFELALDNLEFNLKTGVYRHINNREFEAALMMIEKLY